MSWKPNKKLVEEGFKDLKYVPRERAGWDATLACEAYRARMEIDRRSPDLGAWAARHGLPASGRCAELGEGALVLWHGTSRERADKIAEHGLFHKKGLWTAKNPAIPHSFCRGRSERFGVEGAVVCLVLDESTLVEGRDFEAENENVLRFQHRLPPGVVEYVLVHEEIRFTADESVRPPSPWPGAKFRRREGRWAPVRKTPVKYSDSASYSTPREFAELCVRKLLEESGELAAIEVFSAIYAAVDPWDAITHEEILGVLEEECVPCRRRGKWQTFRAANMEKG